MFSKRVKGWDGRMDKQVREQRKSQREDENFETKIFSKN